MTALIKFLTKEGANAKEIHQRMADVYGDRSPKYSTMAKKSSPHQKFRTQPSAGKVMATVFWGLKGIILIDYKPAGTSMTGEYYANVIKQLRVAIKEK